jgi:hypothetical protein
MTQQIINIGQADKGNGDPLRTAFSKVNENFTELYSAIGADVQIPSQTNNSGKYLTTNGTTLSWVAIIGNGTGLSVTDFGEGFSLTAANKVVTNKLYSTNLTQPTQHYRLELDTNGVVVLPDGSIINGSTIRGVAGTGELNYTGITIGPNSNDAEKTWMWVDHANAYISTNNSANIWTFGTDGSLTFPDTLSIKDSVIGKASTNTITEGEASQTTAIESQIEITTTGVVIAKRTSVTVNDGVITTVNDSGSTLELDNTHASITYYIEPDGPDNNSLIQFTTDSSAGGGATIETVTEDVSGTAHGRVRAAGNSVQVSAKTFLGTNKTWSFTGAGDLQLPESGNILSNGANYIDLANFETSYNDAEGAYQDALTAWMTLETFRPVWFALPGRLAYDEMIAWTPTTGQPALPLNLPPVAKNAQDSYAAWQETIALSKLTVASDIAEFDFNSTGKLRLPQGGTVGGGDQADIDAAYDDWQADEAAWQYLITTGGADFNVRPWNFAGPSRAEKQAIVLSMWQAQQSGAAIDWVPISSAFYNEARAWLAFTANQDGYDEWKKLTTSVNIASEDKTWTFTNDGNLTFPDATVQSTAWTGSVSSLVNGANSVSLDNGGLDLTFTSGEKIRTIFGGGIELYRSGDNTIGIYNSGAEINTFATGGAKHSWTFGTNGQLTLPADGVINSDDSLHVYVFDSNVATLESTYNDKVIELDAAFAADSWTGAGYPAGPTSSQALNIAKALNPLIPDAWITIANELQDAYDAWQAALNGKHWIFGTDGELTVPGTLDYKIGESFGGGSLAITSEGAVNIFTNSVEGFKLWQFDADGNLQLPVGGEIRFGYGYIDQDTDVQGNALRISGGNSVVIKADEDSKTWTFGNDGGLALPAAGKITNGVSTAQVGSALTIATNDSGGTVGWTPTALSVAYDANIISTYFTAGSTITFQDGSTATITGWDDYGPTYIDIFWDTPKTGTLFPIILKSADYAAATTAPEWTFAADGNLVLPNNSIIKDTAGDALAFGTGAGTTSQGNGAVSIGLQAGNVGQGAGSVALGEYAGHENQGTRSVAIGERSGQYGQGAYAIAIGLYAGQDNQHANSIILNASGGSFNSDGTSRFYVNPIRNDSTSTNVLLYNTTTKEVTYGVSPKTQGTFTLGLGTNAISITLEVNATYTMWLRATVDNGVIAYNATVTITNANLPVLGQQQAYAYSGAGTLLDWVSLPTQIVGTTGSVIRSPTVIATPANVFEFYIQNDSEEVIDLHYGYTKI